jgi:hypothetical protein
VSTTPSLLARSLAFRVVAVVVVVDVSQLNPTPLPLRSCSSPSSPSPRRRRRHPSSWLADGRRRLQTSNRKEAKTSVCKSKSSSSPPFPRAPVLLPAPPLFKARLPINSASSSQQASSAPPRHLASAVCAVSAPSYLHFATTATAAASSCQVRRPPLPPSLPYTYLQFCCWCFQFGVPHALGGD